MGLQRITCLISLVATALLVGGLSRPESQTVTPNNFRFQAEELNDNSLWTQVNTEPYHISTAVDLLCRAPSKADYEFERKKNPHAATYITVYVNKVGREAMFAKDVQRFPAGSVIVKKKVGTYFEDRKTLLYTVMKKRESGYNPVVGDWEFLVVSGDGARLEASGKIESCQACHVRKSETDFIFRSYLTAK
jgi:hypothetical protein